MTLWRNNGRGIFLPLTSRAFLLLSAVLLVVSYVSMYFNPAKAWFMTIFGLLFVPLVLLNAILLLLCLLARSRAVLIPLIALLPALFMLGKFYQPGAPSSREGEIKILTYNVGKFGLSKKRLSREECIDSVCAFLKKTDADIICLQEFWFGKASGIPSFFKRKFEGYDCSYYVYPTDNGCYGNVTLSRFPSSGRGKLDFQGSSNLAIYSDYEIDRTKFRVYNCHFQSYSVSLAGAAKSLYRNDTEAVKRTEDKVKKSIVRRPQQVDLVLRDIGQCPVESFVTGDFNDTPMSYTYYRLKKGRKDSFVEGGRGFGATYSALWPFLRIDYILVPESFKVRTYDIVKNSLSDHFPVISSIDVKQ